MQKFETIDGIQVERIVPKDLSEFAVMNPGGVDLYELEQRPKMQVPNIAEVDMNVDRMVAKPRGPYQMALKAERGALIADFRKFENDFKNKGIEIEPLIQAIHFIPNSRFAYYNKLLRVGTQNKKFSQDDIDFVNTVWMNYQAKQALQDYMKNFLDKSLQGFTIKPTPSRSGVRFDAAPGTDKLALKLANPGTVYFPASLALDGDKTEPLVEGLTQIVKRINMQIESLQDDLLAYDDTKDFYSLALPSKHNELSKTVMYARDKLLDKHLRYQDVKKIAEAISAIVGLKRSKYLLSLGDPFLHKTARVPTLITPPSATFSLRSVVPLTTNALGNVAYVFNPFVLYDPTVNFSSFCVNNAATLTGGAIDNNFVAINVGQTLPAAFYVRYRVVSAGIRIYCYPSSNNDNGILVNSVTFENVGTALVGANNVFCGQWGIFNNIENGYYKQTTTIASREVQEHVYIPLDESFWDYQNCTTGFGTFKEGYAWVGYITGAAPSSAIARVELIVNYEALLDNTYTDYLPSESPMEDIEPKTIFAVVNQIKNDQSPMNNKKIEAQLKEQNIALSPEAEISLPPPKQIIETKQQAINGLANTLKDIVTTVVPALPEQKKSSWISEVLDFLSPIASTIVQTAARSFIPTLPPWLKLGKGMI